MKKTLLALTTAVLLAGAAGNASAQERHHDRDRDGVSNRYDRHDDRAARDRDCDGVGNRYDRHDARNAHDRDCDGLGNRWDRNDGRRSHDARRSYAGPRYYGPRDYRSNHWNVGSRLPPGYYGNDYYVDYRPYGLAPPPRGYRWNRVGNDVYLISARDAVIAEAVYNLFR